MTEHVSISVDHRSSDGLYEWRGTGLYSVGYTWTPSHDTSTDLVALGGLPPDALASFTPLPPVFRSRRRLFRASNRWSLFGNGP